MNEETRSDILKLAREIHARLQTLEAAGLKIDVTRKMEGILLNDPSYVPRLSSVRRNTNPLLNAVDGAARVLRTTVSALLGERPHPSVYGEPPSSAELARRGVHAEGGGSATPFTVLLFALDADHRAFATVAELPFVYALGETEAEAIEALREALDVCLIRMYETTMRTIATRGRTSIQAPLHFQPPAEGRIHPRA